MFYWTLINETSESLLITITWTFIISITLGFSVAELVWLYIRNGHFCTAYFSKLVSNQVIPRDPKLVHSKIIGYMSLVPAFIVVSVYFRVKLYQKKHPVAPLATWNQSNSCIPSQTATHITRNNNSGRPPGENVIY